MVASTDKIGLSGTVLTLRRVGLLASDRLSDNVIASPNNASVNPIGIVRQLKLDGGQIVRQGKQLQTNVVVCEVVAGEPRPVQRIPSRIHCSAVSLQLYYFRVLVASASNNT